MIIQDKLEKPFEEYSIRTLVWFKCDYCGKEFQRDKKQRRKLNKIIDKDSCGEKDCRYKKQQESFLVKYGDKNLFATEDFKKKQANTNIEKYGSEEYFDSEDFKQKRLATLQEKFGVDNPLQNEEIKAKQKQTCLDLYGVENYSQTDEFNAKVKETCLNKYNSESPMQNPEILEKRNQTCKEKYGVTNYTKTEEYWKKRKQTCLEKYGVEHPSQLKENREQYAKTCMRRYNVPNGLFLRKNSDYRKTENELRDWLNLFGFNFKSNYTLLHKKEIDLYDSNINLAIEYCGLYWHNELSPNPRPRSYHYNKYKKCLEQGVRLITIFEDEWKQRQEQCKGILSSILNKSNINLFARKCEVAKIDKLQFNEFCEQHHLLASNRLGKVFYALIYDNEIVSAMSLGRHHRSSKSLTLDRFCCKSGVQVVGGASRLFKYCKQWAIENSYQEIISWSDNRWSQGDVYPKIGFILDKELPPDYSYVNLNKPTERISKQSQQKSLTGCPKEITEHEFALSQGLARIWDCGKKRWKFSL